ncbi:uncharacterized, partial [Tachysurus ichikawai]
CQKEEGGAYHDEKAERERDGGGAVVGRMDNRQYHSVQPNASCMPPPERRTENGIAALD